MADRRRDTLPRSTRKPVAGKGPAQRARISRHQRELEQRRKLYIGLGIASALVVGILVFSSLNEYFFKPRAVVASVENVDIRRRDYWKVRSVDLINQINQYQQFASLVDPSQQQQYITLAQQASTDLDNVWGSTDLDETTLNRMVEDEIYLQNMDTLGLSVEDADIDRYINTQFQPADAPLISPTPSPTLIPQRAAWATQTIEAEAQEIDGTFTPTPITDGSPLANPFDDPGTPSSPGGTPEAGLEPGSPSPVASPVVGSPTQPVVASPASNLADLAEEEVVAVVGSPQPSTPVADDGGSPIASPEASPVDAELSPTPNPDQALQTAEAGYVSYQDAVFEQAHLSQSDYERWVVRPAVAREKVRSELTKEVGQTAEQVRAAHILVDTKDLADTIYQSLQEPGASFEQTAIDQSNDTATAPNGGDLGWFARGQMVDAFELVAFTLAADAVSEPTQTEFGWHIIKVYEKDPARALTDQQIEQYRENLVNDWVAARRAEMDVSSDIEPSPTPGISNFVPPADAPPPPVPTEEIIASPVTDDGSILVDATPLAVGSPEAGASPVSVGATPVGSTSVMATMMAVGVASPVASPVIVMTPTAVVVAASQPVESPAAPPRPAVASPAAASLAASPSASPVASPVASPAGTPLATPIV